MAGMLNSVWSENIGLIVRSIFYFRKGDPRIKTHLDIPRSDIQGQKEHWEIIECGEKNPNIPPKVLEKIPSKYRDYVHRQEKGVDMRLACDSLIHVANEKAGNIVLYVNDRDYIPLIESIKMLGANVYVTCLTQDLPVQKKLCDLADRFLTLDGYLENIFNQSQQ
jgi:uncharacterized LabA/DUF88 family protein